MDIKEIKDLLSDRNLCEVGRRTGISYTTLRNIAAGRSGDPSYSTVAKLKEYFSSTCPRCDHG